MTRVATIAWNHGRRHLYDWAAVKTVCGKDAPQWPDVDGPVVYEVTRHWMKGDSCANCHLAATSEALDRCRIGKPLT